MSDMNPDVSVALWLSFEHDHSMELVYDRRLDNMYVHTYHAFFQRENSKVLSPCHSFSSFQWKSQFHSCGYKLCDILFSDYSAHTRLSLHKYSPSQYPTKRIRNMERETQDESEAFVRLYKSDLGERKNENRSGAEMRRSCRSNVLHWGEISLYSYWHSNSPT